MDSSNKARRMSSSLALQVIGLTVFLSLSCHCASVVRLCYLYFGTIDDLGWTFSFNQGRLNAHSELSAMYPSLTFESLYEEAVGFVAVNRSRFAMNFIQKGCRVIFTNNEILLDSQDDTFAASYPNVSFVLLNDQRYYNTQYRNRIYTGFAFSSAFYLGGVAAALQSKNRICFNSAWETSKNPNDAANGFMLGVRSVNATIPIDIITTESWYNPAGDIALANIFIDMGCDIIGRYGDPRDMDVTVAQYGGGKVLTVSPHSNLQLYVGDTVLMAVYTNWAPRLVEIVSDILRTGNPDQSKIPYNFGISSGSVVVTPASALAAPGINAAVAAVQSSKFANSDETYCGALKLNTGASLNYTSGKPCLDPAVLLPGYLDLQQTDHGVFRIYTNCPAGTSYSYATSPRITLQCTPCPANTYSPAQGSATCTACPTGRVSLPGSTFCDIPASTISGGVIAAIVVPIALVLLLGLGGAVYLRQGSAVKNRYAPKESPLCLLFTDVESSTNLWQMYPDGMKKAMAIHHATIRECIAEVNGYEVKTVGDSFMIAVKSPVDGLVLALNIQRRLFAAEWPSEFRYGFVESHLWNGLKVRIGVHFCRDVEPKFEPLHQYYDYYGNDVNVSARIESSARGGQVLVDSSTLQVMREDPDYELLVLADNDVRLSAKDVELKGVEERFSLFQVTPTEFIDRVFEPLPGHENDYKDAHTTDGHTDSLSQSVSRHDHSETASRTSMDSAGAPGSQTKRLSRFLEFALHSCPPADKKRVLDILCKANKVSAEGQMRQLHGIVKHVGDKLAPPGVGAQSVKREMSDIVTALEVEPELTELPKQESSL
jgi:class 3 adenylate cyclase/basic membrane lipoprotein Med (substrate-binding protein (PBP1-ABC) superfamily)